MHLSPMIPASSSDISSSISICANCGKEGSDMNKCNKCKEVMYCNAACKKKHRTKHKKKCERRVAELHDEALFKQPPPLEDCPICFLRMPYFAMGRRYMGCCGKVICVGCIHADQSTAEKTCDKQCACFLCGRKNAVVVLCAFCRTPATNICEEEEFVKRIKKRMEMNDPNAIFSIGCYYSNGIKGYPQNHTKALELWHRAGELGCVEAYYNIGMDYIDGRGVEADMEKAKQYHELAAIGGEVSARYSLAMFENQAGNFDRELKHLMIAAGTRDTRSLDFIKELYKTGYTTKDVYAKALKLNQAYLDDIRSDQRDKAAANRDDYRYY